METRKIFKCFISSPGDCQRERDNCQTVIDGINLGLGKHLGINLDTFMWEYDVLPDMGMNGQEIIDSYIEKSRYDIFIGIMKNRFGHPTKKAGSGTEHEYNDALKRKTSNPTSSLPRILFFFGKESVDPDKFDFSQYQKVKDFKSKLSTNGLYIDFDESNSFHDALKQKLELFVKENSPLDHPEKKIIQVDEILNRLEGDLNESLKTYNEQSPIWIDPIISTKKQIPSNPSSNDENRVNISSIIDAPLDIIIKAPSEFGLTSLAHHIKLEAWKAGKTFIYIDSIKTKKHKVVKEIAIEAEKHFFKNVDEIDCILLDTVCFEHNGIMQIIKNICDEYKDVPLIIFNGAENNFFLQSDEDDKVEIKRRFASYYLLPLPQKDVRKIVESYSKFKCLEENNDVILAKVTKDLETLNMHRTPKNCISILRACSKIGKDYTPINRTKLLDTILTTIFDEYEIPTYRDKKPDTKDCSFVLGYLCELLVRRNSFEFDEAFFKSSLKEFCLANYIDIDMDYLLNVLLSNSIFSKHSDVLSFKNSYWFFYFIGQRMNMNKGFLEYVYENKKYIDYPEIIEFYTGVDRNKRDALEKLLQDIEQTLSLVKAKVNLPDNLNPFKSIEWNPDVSMLEKEEAKIGQNVISSGLPDEIKDKYEDKKYNQIRPYNQVINSVIRDYSLLVLMRQISASSRALRNSDFVDAKVKSELLDKILLGWNEMNKFFIVFSPILADRGNINFEGASFTLDESFKDDNSNDKRLNVLLSVPFNVVSLFKDDLFSAKMGPLILNKAKNETNSLLKHELMFLIGFERPKDWHKIIDNYIVSLDKNSFFLSDIMDCLDMVRDYKFVEEEDRRLLNLLSRKCRAKHIFKKDNPDINLINKLSN